MAKNRFLPVKDFAKQGVARSCGKATDFELNFFLGAIGHTDQLLSEVS